MLSILSVLAFFSLIALSSGVYFAAKKLRIPYTVLLVLVGMLLVPITSIPGLESSIGFIVKLELTPELLFYVFLPILIFESGFNMNMRKFLDSFWAISILSVFGVLISTLVIATLMFFGLPLIGLEIPFIVALLFGAIISAIDPVAVLALFKEVGAPKRLSMIFEGESLFNDGTAVALFLVLFAIATDGYNGASTLFEGSGMFIGMILFGIGLGLVLAGIFTKILRLTKSNEFVAITLLITSAHIVFIVGELINQNSIFGLHIHVSSIIATTILALFMGNYARSSLSPKSDDYLNKFIEHMAFLANSLVFLLAGLLFASSNIDFTKLWSPILITVAIVAFARVVSVYAIVPVLNRLKLEQPIPSNWQLLLAWGSLRGALAIIVILLIPPDFSISGWNYEYSIREFLLAVTIGCILTTLFIKAPLINPLINKLGINKPDPLEETYQLSIRMYYLLTERNRIESHRKREFIDEIHFKKLISVIDSDLDLIKTKQSNLVKNNKKSLFDQSVQLVAINAEMGVLKNLYINEEVNETIYRRLTNKLNLQADKIEKALHDSINPSAYMDNKDLFLRLSNFTQNILRRTPNATITLQNELLYYRTQMIMARKCVKTLTTMQTQYGNEVFLPDSYQKTVGRYEAYREKAEKKVQSLLSKNRETLSSLMDELAEKSLKSSGSKALDYLIDRNILDEQQLHSFHHDTTTSKH